MGVSACVSVFAKEVRVLLCASEESYACVCVCTMVSVPVFAREVCVHVCVCVREMCVFVCKGGVFVFFCVQGKCVCVCAHVHVLEACVRA